MASHEKKEYNEQIKALYEISRAITSDMYLEDILKLIVNVTAQMTGSKICSIMLIDEKEKLIKIRASQAISDEYLKKPPLKIDEGIAGKVVKTGQPVLVRDVRKEPDFKHREIAVRENMVSMLAVPMKVKGKITGVLNIYTAKPHKFGEREIEILSSIANQSAIIIENTELMVKTKVLEEEIDIRKKVEKAKGILMREEKITEEEAYNRLRKFSMDNRKNMKEVAEAIIIAAEIKK
ncbi:MAG: GAF and ANTAR domain-containing protein [Candidatus Omnitrophica bacterium]|nr:GAF and ANTAR domain-containing protein [Candidatus Omnitrophota bacterium]